MEKIIKNVLNTIEKNGFEAYIVGGYVRDFLLNKKTYDVDICTNALPKDLKNLFPFADVGIYGAISFRIKSFSFEVTTYREEIEYENRHPKTVNYVSNLLTDLNRRDFIINSVCMNKDGLIIDMLNGIDDIKNGVINSIGNPNTKFSDDPLRILRAIRFATILNFKLSDELEEAIYKNYKSVALLSKNRIKNELDKILISENALYGIDLLKKFGILKIIGLFIENSIKVSDLCGMWSLFEFEEEYPFTKEDKNNIIIIKKMTKKGYIDNKDLFNHGLYLCTVVGEILDISKQKINNMYKSLPIYSLKDICVSSKDIIKYLRLDSGKMIGDIQGDIILNILNKNLKNNKKSIYKFLERYRDS